MESRDVVSVSKYLIDVIKANKTSNSDNEYTYTLVIPKVGDSPKTSIKVTIYLYERQDLLQVYKGTSKLYEGRIPNTFDELDDLLRKDLKLR